MAKNGNELLLVGAIAALGAVFVLMNKKDEASKSSMSGTFFVSK